MDNIIRPHDAHIDTHMTLTWCSHDAHMTLTWCSHDAHMMPILTPTWHSHDAHMMPTWSTRSQVLTLWLTWSIAGREHCPPKVPIGVSVSGCTRHTHTQHPCLFPVAWGWSRWACSRPTLWGAALFPVRQYTQINIQRVWNSIKDTQMRVYRDVQRVWRSYTQSIEICMIHAEMYHMNSVCRQCTGNVFSEGTVVTISHPTNGLYRSSLPQRTVDKTIHKMGVTWCCNAPIVIKVSGCTLHGVLWYQSTPTHFN